MLLPLKYFRFALLLVSLSGFITTTFSAPSNDLLGLIEQKAAVNQKKVDAAFAAMETVQQAGAYIDALSDLFESGEIALPVGIRKGDYE